MEQWSIWVNQCLFFFWTRQLPPKNGDRELETEWFPGKNHTEGIYESLPTTWQFCKRDLFGMVSSRHPNSKVNRDLQLGDNRVTLNHQLCDFFLGHTSRLPNALHGYHCCFCWNSCFLSAGNHTCRAQHTCACGYKKTQTFAHNPPWSYSWLFNLPPVQKGSLPFNKRQVFLQVMCCIYCNICHASSTPTSTCFL